MFDGRHFYVSDEKQLCVLWTLHSLQYTVNDEFLCNEILSWEDCKNSEDGTSHFQETWKQKQIANNHWKETKTLLQKVVDV